MKIPIVLTTTSSEEVLLTEDVSFSGVFVRTDAVRPARQLVQVRLVLPTTEEELSVTAGVVHTIAPASTSARIGGMGLRFRALDAGTRERWDAFVRTCSDLHRGDPEHGLSAINSIARLSNVAPIRRRFPRIQIERRVHLRTREDLRALVTRDLSHGGTFVTGAADCPPGTLVSVVIQHPCADQTLTLTGKVVRAVRNPPERRGLGVAFDDLTPHQQTAIDTFVDAETDADADILVFDEDGP